MSVCLQGLHIMTLAWGPWGEVGMATRSTHIKQVMQAEGVGFITTREGLELLSSILGPSGEECLTHVSYFVVHRSKQSSGMKR